MDAQFSVPYTISAATIKRKLDISAFKEPATQGPSASEIAQKVNPRFDPALARIDINPSQGA